MFDDWTVDVPQTYKMILKAAFGAQYKIEIRAPTSRVVSKQPAIVKKTHLCVYLIWATGIRWWRLCVNRKISNEIVVIKNCNFDVSPFFGGVKKSETFTNLGQLILYVIGGYQQNRFTDVSCKIFKKSYDFWFSVAAGNFYLIVV
jgi:hypothetical protein